MDVTSRMYPEHNFKLATKIPTKNTSTDWNESPVVNGDWHQTCYLVIFFLFIKILIWLKSFSKFHYFAICLSFNIFLVIEDKNGSEWWVDTCWRIRNCDKRWYKKAINNKWPSNIISIIQELQYNRTLGLRSFYWLYMSIEHVMELQKPRKDTQRTTTTFKFYRKYGNPWTSTCLNSVPMN